jgi:SAM-dependent methyltransferase
MEEPTDRVTAEAFAYKYLRLATLPARRLRRATLGSAVPNGYTSVDQADRMAQLLGLGPGSGMLDLGSGRGWPGARIAARTGCDLVVTDLPLAALREARGALRAEPNASRHVVVCADGTRLPFRDASFDAVTHADVLC